MKMKGLDIKSENHFVKRSKMERKGTDHHSFFIFGFCHP